MNTRLMIASAAAVTLMAGAAFAQDTAVNPSSDTLPAGVATGNAVPADPAPAAYPASDSATVAPAAGAAAERAPVATAGTELVSNGPVPDTMENRKKYGMPMSNAGRHTKPAGN